MHITSVQILQAWNDPVRLPWRTASSAFLAGPSVPVNQNNRPTHKEVEISLAVDLQPELNCISVVNIDKIRTQ